MTLLRFCCFTLILLASHTFAGGHLDTSRLLVGFHGKDYMEMGGAADATDYINSRWGDKPKISLVRPMGNSTILVELIKEDVSSLNEVIDDLSRMQKIRFVEKELTTNHFPEPNLDIPSINN